MYLIAAADRGWGIGKDNGLLYHIPEDMHYFREMTLGSTVVMGRRTLESFPGGKPLPKRRNIVLTRQRDYDARGAETVQDVEALLRAVEGEERVFLIGGESLYKGLLYLCDRAYITMIEAEREADAFLPDLDADPEWELKESSGYKEYNDIRYRFLRYERKA